MMGARQPVPVKVKYSATGKSVEAPQLLSNVPRVGGLTSANPPPLQSPKHGKEDEENNPHVGLSP